MYMYAHDLKAKRYHYVPLTIDTQGRLETGLTATRTRAVHGVTGAATQACAAAAHTSGPVEVVRTCWPREMVHKYFLINFFPA